MAESSSNSAAERVRSVVQRLLTQRSISRTVAPPDDLRDAGLTSMDMVNLFLAVETEFDVMIQESRITPANFRSVAAISSLIDAFCSSLLSGALKPGPCAHRTDLAHAARPPGET